MKFGELYDRVKELAGLYKQIKSLREDEIAWLDENNSSVTVLMAIRDIRERITQCEKSIKALREEEIY